jgi:hypothetical protein
MQDRKQKKIPQKRKRTNTQLSSKNKQKKSYVCRGCNEKRMWRDVLKSLPDYVLESIRKASAYRHGHKVSDAQVISDALTDGSIYCSWCMKKWHALYPKNIEKQRGYFNARHLFRDVTLECRICKKQFIYTAEHQRYLRETLDVAGTPRFCAECGKIERMKEKCLAQIQTLLVEAKENPDYTVYLQIACLFYKAKNEKKSEYYLRRAKNLAFKKAEWPQFCTLLQKQTVEMQEFINKILGKKATFA